MYPHHQEYQRGLQQRRKIVRYLQQQKQPVRYADLAEHLDVSITAVYWHVLKLRRDGIIAKAKCNAQRAIRLERTA